MLLGSFAVSAGMDPQLLKQTIERRLGVQVYLVDETPVSGLYLLGTAQGPLYTDARGDHVLLGTMLDLAHDMKNLTMLGQRQQRQLALAQIGERRMQLKAVPERHRLTLFTDLACRGCRTTLAELPALQARGVSVQLLPVLGPLTNWPRRRRAGAIPGCCVNSTSVIVCLRAAVMRSLPIISA